jgi:hypothetical protein
MEILNHLFTALGRLLLWGSSALVLEELMWGGLARLLLSRTSKSRATRARKQTVPASEVRSKEVQGETSC